MNARMPRSLLLTSLLSLGLFASSTASELKVYFGPCKPGAANGLDTQTVKLIASAKKRINAAVHEVRLKSIADAFIAAHKRGVVVRMVGEDRYYDNEFMKAIRAAGIPTRSDENPNAIMHNKFVVADGERMLTGSYNLTNTCSYDNYNNLVVIEDKGMCKIFDDEFEQLFAGHIYDENVTGAVHNVTLKLADRDVPIEIFFQPRNQDSEAKVLELLRSSKQGIYALQFAFFNGKVGALMQEKFKANQEVKAVIDFSMVFGDFSPYNQIGRLVEAGIPFCIGDDPNGKLHHKVFTVDPDDDNAMVLTGSANSSSAGFNKNAENIIVIHDRKIAQAYRDECNRLLRRRDSGKVTVAPRGLTGINAEHHFDLSIESGGKPMKDVELSLPYHWRVKSLSDVAAWRGDEANLRPNLKLESRVPSRYTSIPVQSIVVKGLNLTASGPGSRATVRVKTLRHDPETLPGKYVIYARGADSTGKLQALPAMPIIWLFRTAAENVGFMAKLLESQEIRASRDLEFLVRDLQSSLEQEIERNRTDALKDLVFLLEKAREGNNPRFKIVAPLVQPLVAKLNFAITNGSPAAAEMRELVTRLKGMQSRRN